MALDDFFMARLDSIKRTFDALTERLADPDVANDRKQMLTLSRERAAVEKTVDAYDEWKVKKSCSWDCNNLCQRIVQKTFVSLDVALTHISSSTDNTIADFRR